MKLPGNIHPPITREEVEAFITALNYGMKVSHKPEFLIALAEGWLAHSTEKETPKSCQEKGYHTWETLEKRHGMLIEKCTVCEKIERTLY